LGFCPQQPHKVINMRVLSCLALAAAGCTASAGSISKAELQAVLQRYADSEHELWNMSLTLAFYSPSILPDTPLVAAASGYTNGGLEIPPKGPPRQAKTDDVYVWGSITKMFTCPAVFQLIEEGLVDLEDNIAKHIDPWLQRVNGTKLSDRFGRLYEKITIRDLLHMTSGITDYDRGNYSSDQFASPTTDFSPIDILGKYVPTKMEFPTGEYQDYCSTNYILLGMVLANHRTTSTQWQAYDQTTVFPPSVRKTFNSSTFVDKGACSAYTPVHGIMAPSYYDPDAKGDTDVWNVSCTGGWTAGNYIGSALDVAKFTYDLYGPEAKIVSKESQAHLINFTAPNSHHKFYGMGTFSLDWTASTETANITGYGHVGDTYGYQSQTTYFPDLDFVITVATNVESASQAQPAEATCKVYHAIVAAMERRPDPKCTFEVPHRFIGKCLCP